MRGRALTGTASLRKARVVSRAAALFCGEIESSRSSSRASAPLPRPFSSFFGLSPGMKRKERIVQNLVDGTGQIDAIRNPLGSTTARPEPREGSPGAVPHDKAGDLCLMLGLGDQARARLAKHVHKTNREGAPDERHHHDQARRRELPKVRFCFD